MQRPLSLGLLSGCYRQVLLYMSLCVYTCTCLSVRVLMHVCTCLSVCVYALILYCGTCALVKKHCCGRATIVAQCVAVGDKQILAKFVFYAGYV